MRHIFTQRSLETPPPNETEHLASEQAVAAAEELFVIQSAFIDRTSLKELFPQKDSSDTYDRACAAMGIDLPTIEYLEMDEYTELCEEIVQFEQTKTLQDMGLEFGHSNRAAFEPCLSKGENFLRHLETLQPDHLNENVKGGYRDLVRRYLVEDVHTYLPASLLEEAKQQYRYLDTQFTSDQGQIFRRSKREDRLNRVRRTLPDVLPFATQIAEEFQRLGIESKTAQQLSELSCYHQEGTLVEAMLADNLEVLTRPVVPQYVGLPNHRDRLDGWEHLTEIIKYTQTKAPNGLLEHTLRENVVGGLVSHLTAMKKARRRMDEKARHELIPPSWYDPAAFYDEVERRLQFYRQLFDGPAA